MSSNSLRHVIRRREHRERSQPLARQSRFGLLEKKKDYKLRAQDYHRKQDALKIMKEKAAFRNEDEFYMNMNKTQTKNGVHILERKNTLTPKTIKIMKAQDLAYLQSQRNNDLKRIEKAKQNMHFLMEDAPETAPADDDDQGFADESDEEERPRKKAKASALQSKHVIFVDSDKDLASFDAAAYFQTAPELVGRKFNRLRAEQLQQGHVMLNNTRGQKAEQREKHASSVYGQTAAQQAAAAANATVTSHALQARADQSLLASYSEINARLERKRKLDDALAKLQLEKHLGGKGPRKRIVVQDKFGEVDEKKTVYKWKLQRKK